MSSQNKISERKETEFPNRISLMRFLGRKESQHPLGTGLAFAPLSANARSFSVRVQVSACGTGFSRFGRGLLLWGAFLGQFGL